MTGHRPFSELTKDFSPQRKAEIEALTNRLREEMAHRDQKVQNMVTRTFTAVLHKEGDSYVAQCLEVGTTSQGQTPEEALANLKEATELYLEEFPLPKTSRPLVTTFEVSSVA